MHWFKNAMIYRLTKDLDWSLASLNLNLTNNAFSPCDFGELSKFGWFNPLKSSDLFYFAVGKQILLVAQKEDKMLPANVVKRELEARIEQLEQKEQRKLKKTEKQSLKDEIIQNLLPRAFSKYQQTAIWIDAENNLIYVDAASSKRAEDALALLRKTLGSLPVVPLTFAKEPALEMKQWLQNESTPEWIIPLEEAELRDLQTDGVIRCKKQTLESEEMLALLDRKLVTKLALDWDEHLSFILNEDCSLKRLKFADQLREKNDDIRKEDFAQRFDADFVLMTGVLSKLTENLLHAFGGEKERL